MGFVEFLDDTHEGYIITSYNFPNDPHFFFQDFYRRLSDKGLSFYYSWNIKSWIDDTMS